MALNFAYKKSGKTLQVKELFKDDILLKKMLSTSKQAAGDPTIRLVKLEPQGWVLVSGDDVARAIIGYSLEGEFDENNLPPQLEWMLEAFSKQITETSAKKNVAIPLETSLEWEKLKKDHLDFKEKNVFNPSEALNDETTRSMKAARAASYESWSPAKEVSLYTPRWNQRSPYNTFTPSGTPTGCVATAMAEIMGYHRFPLLPQNLQAYHDGGANNYYVQPEAPFIQYDWSSILSGNDNLGLARLVQHAGIAVRMDYEPGGSGAFTRDAESALRNNFNYHTYGYHTRSSYSVSKWHAKIRTDLRQGYPVCYQGGVDPSTTGVHTFVIEGFDVEGSFYAINFGWSGHENGYYTLDDITPYSDDFSGDQKAIFGIKPRNDAHRDPYEIDNHWSTASDIEIGETQPNHNIDPGNDEDYIGFFVSGTNRNVTIETTPNSNTSNGYNDTVIYLYNHYGELVAYDDDGGVNLFSKIITNLQGGQYYINIIGYNENRVSSYDLKVHY